MARLIRGMFHPGLQMQMKQVSGKSGVRFCQTKSGNSSVRIACASGFWGDTPTAVPQLVYGAQVHYGFLNVLSVIKDLKLQLSNKMLESVTQHSHFYCVRTTTTYTKFQVCD